MTKKKARSLQTLDRVLNAAKTQEEYNAIRDAFTPEEDELWFDREYEAMSEIRDKFLLGATVLAQTALAQADENPHISAEMFRDWIRGEFSSGNYDEIDEMFATAEDDEDCAADDKEAREAKWVHIGDIAIDTGRLVMSDPCRIDEVMEAIGHEHQACYREGALNMGTGLVLPTGLGDGIYPVMAMYDDTFPSHFGPRISRLVINFANPFRNHGCEKAFPHDWEENCAMGDPAKAESKGSVNVTVN